MKKLLFFLFLILANPLAHAAVQRASGSVASSTITGKTEKGSPAAGDFLLCTDGAAADALKKCDVGDLPSGAETDPVVGAITGIVKADGGGNISAASAGTDYVVPAGNVATATALAANGADCSAGSAPIGVDASGAAESCFDVWTESENTAAGYTALTDEASLYAALSDVSQFYEAGDDVTSDVTAADTTTAGKIEIATAAETTTGTDATRAVSPDGLAGSNFGIKVVTLKWQAEDGTTGTGDGAACLVIPAEINGMNLVSVGAHVYTASSSGAPTYMIRNQTDTADMLSVALTIDANEKDSATAATAATINGATDDVVTGDEICVDKDGAGTGEAGDEIRLGFQLP